MAQQLQTAPKESGGNRRDLTKTHARLEKQVTRAESEIAEFENKVKSRETELADPALYKEFGKWNSLHEEQGGWKRDLERMTARWESLSAELEKVKQELGALS